MNVESLGVLEKILNAALKRKFDYIKGIKDLNNTNKKSHKSLVCGMNCCSVTEIKIFLVKNQ